jgi:ABC-type branched-subunit amino acid transport system permease subunit
VIVFCISAFLAGISGALFGGIFRTAGQSSFTFFNSLILLAIMAITATFLRTLPAAILAAILYQVVGGYINSPRFTLIEPLLFGIGALVAALLSQGSGVATWFAREARATQWRARSPVAARRLAPDPTAATTPFAAIRGES